MASDKQHEWNASRYREHAGFVSRLGEGLFDWLVPRAGERILDLGCGEGELALKIQQAGCSVLAVDSSAAMIKAAAARGLESAVVDGEHLGFHNEFDAVFSNAALHWMTRPERVVEGIWRALKPGGRLVAEFGGHGNVRSIVRVLQEVSHEWGRPIESPWYFPTPREYGALLVGQGFDVVRIIDFDRPTLLPGDVTAWLETFAQTWLAGLDETDTHQFLSEVGSRLAPLLRQRDGRWVADYVRLRVEAIKPSEVRTR